MKLTFCNSENKERVLGIFETKEEANAEIRKFLNEHHYTSHYWRIITFHDKEVYDVGSWSEFFILYNDDDAEINKRGVWEE